jgi:hypothetical protein
MECPHRGAKAHRLYCHTRLGIGHSLMPLVLVGATTNGSKRSSEMLQSSATGEPSPPSEQMESVLPRLPLEKQLSIPSCRYGVRAGRPAPQSKPYGFSSDLARIRRMTQ